MREEINEMAKDVIAFLKSKGYSDADIYFILRRALEVNEEELWK